MRIANVLTVCGLALTMIGCTAPPASDQTDSTAEINSSSRTTRYLVTIARVTIPDRSCGGDVYGSGYSCRSDQDEYWDLDGSQPDPVVCIDEYCTDKNACTDEKDCTGAGDVQTNHYFNNDTKIFTADELENVAITVYDSDEGYDTHLGFSGDNRLSGTGTHSFGAFGLVGYLELEVTDL